MVILTILVVLVLVSLILSVVEDNRTGSQSKKLFSQSSAKQDFSNTVQQLVLILRDA